MKLILAAVIGAAVALPAAAAPSRWSSGYTGGVREYRVGNPGHTGTSMILSCPDKASPFVTVLINGVLPPSGELVGFKAAGRTIAIRTGDSGSIKVNTDKDRAAFASLWPAIRAGSTIRISYTNGVEASLSLLGSARALPARACGKL